MFFPGTAHSVFGSIVTYHQLKAMQRMVTKCAAKMDWILTKFFLASFHRHYSLSLFSGTGAEPVEGLYFPAEN